MVQGNLRQDDFPTLSGGPQGGHPDTAAYGRHPAYDEDERHFMQPSGDLLLRTAALTHLRCLAGLYKVDLLPACFTSYKGASETSSSAC